MTEDDVRRIALSLPETTEKPWFGAPGFRVKDKGFARIREDGLVVVFVESLEEKEALLAAAPDRFTTLPHYDGWPTVLIKLDGIGEAELTEMVTESWRIKAPKRVLAAFDATRA